MKLRKSRPAPTSSTQANATSPTTRALRAAAEARPALRWWLAFCSAAVAAREVQRWQHGAGDAGQRGQADGDGEREGIDGRILQQRDAEGLEPRQRAGRPHRERHADQRTREGKDQALGQRLLDEVPAPRAEGHADGEFLAANVDAGEQQVGEVHARDREHAGDGAGSGPGTGRGTARAAPRRSASPRPRTCRRVGSSRAAAR